MLTLVLFMDMKRFYCYMYIYMYMCMFNKDIVLSVQAKLNVVQSIQRFLNKYGFRCINELKLEEHTLHDDPGFVLDTIAGEWYIHSVS